MHPVEFLNGSSVNLHIIKLVLARAHLNSSFVCKTASSKWLGVFLTLFTDTVDVSVFTFLVNVAVHGLHLSSLLRGGLLGCSSNPKTTPVGCVPSSSLYPTHTHTHTVVLNAMTQNQTIQQWGFRLKLWSSPAALIWAFAYLLIPLTSSEAHGWCMLRHQPPSDISWSSRSWRRSLERSSPPLSSSRLFPWLLCFL